MSDHTNSATDPILDLIPAKVRHQYLDFGRGIDAFDEKIASLQRQRRVLLDERQAIIDMAAADMTSDLGIVALRKSGPVAEQRLVDEVRAISPYLYDTIEFSATGTEENFVGPYISLVEQKSRPLADTDPFVVADALIEFARRFCPTPPETGKYAGMVCADVITGNGAIMTILYTPDGSDARLAIGRRHQPLTGPLVEIVAAAVAEVIRQAAADDHDS